ncbi:hypothetical protein [Chengkuizengella marina]|uniref:Uncharacterized protein n=1 Tax=Chengkuizengella marina TaxID=2507566 RepID=A0A6N9PYN7_9BACL|nr:hypothetical protein [Chengkuizengella marina]NBI28631.1 hypothetical protein [Chengkuizengella marina]
MNKNELIDLLSYDKVESNVFMPNEIFNDLSSDLTNSSHIAFSYSYYYLISYLYRYCKYIDKHYDPSTIKQILSYSSTNKTLDYLIKKNGVLDQLKYTNTIKDYPLQWSLEDGIVDFIMYSETLKEANKITMAKNQKVKKPLKCFFRAGEQCEEGEYDGTFYDISNTHLIPFEVFLECFSNSQLGCEEFYLYGFLKHLNDKFPEGVQLSINSISEQSGIKLTLTKKTLNYLKKFRMISLYPSEFSIGSPKETWKANKYIINNYNNFSIDPIEYRKSKVTKYA